MSYFQPSPNEVYRAAVTAVDVLTAPGDLTTSAHDGGSLPNSTYKSKVVAVNGYGRTTATAGTDRATNGQDNSVKIAFDAVAGATHYDIYLSIDSDPKWVARITEADRAAGCIVTAVATVTQVGGEAGSVIVEVAGTGLQSDVTAAVNTAYNPPAAVDVDTHETVHFDVAMTITGDAVAPSLVVVPYFYDGSTYYSGTPIAIVFGGVAGEYKALKQRISVECKGRDVALVVQAIAGTGASLDINVSKV